MYKEIENLAVENSIKYMNELYQFNENIDLYEPKEGRYPFDGEIHYEHYVSFETAKKLESIDFPQNSVECFYRDNGHIYKRNHYNLKEIYELVFKSSQSPLHK